MEHTGLILEGGGMRGSFTAGVLHYFMENDLYFPYVIGVSAGACNGSSYLSRQKDRNRIVNIDYIEHPEYISIKRFFKNRELLGMDFLFNKLPNELAPFDYETFYKAPEKFIVGTTDCQTGQAVYFEKSAHQNNMLTILRASSSLPFIAPEVEYDGKYLLDGGISDPIPIRKSESDGNRKNVVILTRNEGYVKSKSSFQWYVKRKFRHYPSLAKTMLERHETYNKTVQYIEEQEKNGNAFVIRPIEKLEVSRIERNPDKLKRLYVQGYEEAQRKGKALNEFLKRTSISI
ncbi:putative patatin/cPLA2 family phospholipase [Salirhabdus euzebyi]|uniref:Putative patatin/cPLA2 family phospholipase n=1 Tax=Salirhabdus euzebyi TaxID=394506 RepID=A0A841PTP5_9BACI|nr:patatin family protein [Salirhabdus euzebyi]MBB6452357.1 putative patatin/cPLA2 family phospholipase [Salirhabdus euzebyi]